MKNYAFTLMMGDKNASMARALIIMESLSGTINKSRTEIVD
jgi:hypothetical protein